MQGRTASEKGNESLSWNGPGFAGEETEQTRLVAFPTSLGASESDVGEDCLFCWGREVSELMDERQKMQSAVLECPRPNI